jgi:hypothetical protein
MDALFFTAEVNVIIRNARILSPLFFYEKKSGTKENVPKSNARDGCSSTPPTILGASAEEGDGRDTGVRQELNARHRFPTRAP